MAKLSKTTPVAPPAEPARKLTQRRKTADQRLRIVDRLTTGLSVAHIARVEGLTVRRVRQIIAEMLESREIEPPAGYVQLQIARLGEAMVVAHTLMLDGKIDAMDRFIKLAAELDRYHGFGRAQISAADSPRRLAAPEREPPPRLAAEEEIFLPANP
jgi:hypothetical protein